MPLPHGCAPQEPLQCQAQARATRAALYDPQSFSHPLFPGEKQCRDTHTHTPPPPPPKRHLLQSAKRALLPGRRGEGGAGAGPAPPCVSPCPSLSPPPQPHPGLGVERIRGLPAPPAAGPGAVPPRDELSPAARRGGRPRPCGARTGGGGGGGGGAGGRAGPCLSCGGAPWAWGSRRVPGVG